MSGYHEITGLENQLLVLLFMAWFVADQLVFYSRDIVEGSRHGFDRLAVTVVSDKLSGDDDSRPHNEQTLRRLVDPEDESVPIILTRSPKSDVFTLDGGSLYDWYTDRRIGVAAELTEASDSESLGRFCSRHGRGGSDMGRFSSRHRHQRAMGRRRFLLCRRPCCGGFWCWSTCSEQGIGRGRGFSRAAAY
jgi:hypothetical protein